MSSLYTGTMSMLYEQKRAGMLDIVFEFDTPACDVSHVGDTSAAMQLQAHLVSQATDK